MRRRRVFACALALAVAGALLLSQAASAADPSASFLFEPQSPAAGDPVTFASSSTDPDNDIVTTEWDFSYDGVNFNAEASGTTVSQAFPAPPGPERVAVRVTDSTLADGTIDESIAERVVNVRGWASFGVSPPAPRTLQSVTLTAGPAPAGEAITGRNWDLDNDGEFDDANGPQVKQTFLTPEPRTIRVRMTSTAGGLPSGGEDVATRRIVPGNRSPSASFIISPSSAKSEQKVTFTSTSSDPDGPIVAQHWDLDNDGLFDDASGSTASRSFSGPARIPVQLRVGDTSDVEAYALGTVVVSDPSAASLISPFPVVRIVGGLTRRGARIRLFAVKAPSGSQVVVRCRGRGCPFRRRSRRAGQDRLRFRSLERRLRAGVRIEIFVTKPGLIGKYTRFRIRRRKAPARSDLCLRPDDPTTPRACP